jgi:hypothetical protein
LLSSEETSSAAHFPIANSRLSMAPPMPNIGAEGYV